MQHTPLSRVALLVVMAASATAFASAAHAQMGGAFDPGAMLKQGANQGPDMSKAPVVQPPALPGATPHAEAAAPATRIPSDMSPNDALFDAINRGDMAAAHDALDRGADLNARNILGMTPLELSVDLGRNDISFLLLSFRGEDSPQRPPSQAASATTPAAGGKAVASRPGHAAVVPVRAVTPPPARQTPHLFAGDGGTPVPSDGFLGFNTGRATQ